MRKTVLSALLLALCFTIAGLTAVWAEGPWNLATTDTRMQFSLSGGIPVISELRSVVAGDYNWATGEREVSMPVKVTINGKNQNITWVYDGATASDRQVDFTYHSTKPALELVSRWESTALPGPIEHSVFLTNSDSRKVALNLPPTTALKLRKLAGHSYLHWWVEKASGDVAPGGPHADPIGNNYSRSLVCGPYSTDMETRDEIPWLCIHDTTAGSVVYGGIEYSGWTEIFVKKNSSYIDVTMGLQQQHYNTVTQTSVEPGSTLPYPPTFVGVYAGDVEDACNRLHRWVESHLRPPVPGGITPLLVNNSWCLGMDVNESRARSMIDDCASLGMEMFHMDAGWYRQVGDWRPDPAKFPNGLAALADYAHSMGVKFGLWAAWTQGGDMKTYNDEMLTVFNPSQAPWFIQDFAADWTAQPFSGATVCLAAAGAQNWCLTDLKRIVSSYRLDMLEHDQPMIPDQGCQRTDHGHTANDWVDASRAACDGYYGVYDSLRQQHPKIFFEDCVNGGRLIDYGVVQRVHYYSVTDTNDAITLRQAFYDSSYPMPPSMIELYIDQNSEGNIPLQSYPGGLVYMLRSAMLGWPTIQTDASTWTKQQRRAAQREFAFFKEKLRPLVAQGNLYHVLPRPDDANWDGVQYYDPASGKGALLVFRPYSATGSMTIRLRGFDPARNYLVESADGSVAAQTLSGSTLTTAGVTVTLPGEITSDLVFFTVQ